MFCKPVICNPAQVSISFDQNIYYKFSSVIYQLDTYFSVLINKLEFVDSGMRDTF